MSKEEDRSADLPGNDGADVEDTKASSEHGDPSHIDNDGCSIGSLESVSDSDGVGTSVGIAGGISAGCEKYAGMSEKELEAMALEKIRAAEAAWAAECDVHVEERKALLKAGAPPPPPIRHTGPLFHNMSLAYGAHPDNPNAKEEADDSNGSDAKSDRTAPEEEEEEEAEQVYCFQGSNAAGPPVGGVFAIGNTSNQRGAGNSGPAYEFGLRSGKKNGLSLAASLQNSMVLGASME